MFGTSGVRGTVGDAVTADVALAVGRALGSTDVRDVVLGRDARGNGVFLADALAAGLQECGVSVTRVGRAATPTVARSVEWLDADAGVVVTASHNPPTDNGFKLWKPNGQAFDAEDRAEIERRVETGDFELAEWDATGKTSRWGGAADEHREALRRAVDDTAFDGLSVVVDIGNGVGALTAETLTDLGASVETLNGQPDGRFPGRPSEPTAETCSALRDRVARSDADLGVAHDGDADRTMAVDSTGSFVTGDELLAVFARETATDGDTVVAPVNTSLTVEDTLAGVGATLDRTPVGDAFVAERIAETGAVFGGEPSGAWIWPEETLCPDGPLAALKLAEIVATRGPLAELLESVEACPIRRESVETRSKERVVERVGSIATNRFDGATTTDGVRVETDDGWFLVRASGTQPLIRLTAEGRDEAKTDELLDSAEALLDEASEPTSGGYIGGLTWLTPGSGE